VGQDNDCGECSYRAWAWRGGGEPGDLMLERVEMPELAPGQVLVRNQVIGLNPVDWKVLARSSEGDWRSGHVPGVDGAGTVIALGDDVPEDWLGRRVAYHTNLASGLGSFADYTPVAARALMRVPDGLDMTVAASFPCPGLTAWQALDKLPFHEGARLLVSGAGGAVGNYLVQLAAARGFAVTAMCNPRHLDRLQSLGAQACIVGPLPEGDVWPETEARRFFAVIDAVNASHAARLVPALAANGHVLCIQGRLEGWPAPPFGRALSMHEVALGALHRHGSDADWARLTQAGERMLADLETGRLRPEPLSVAAFADLPRHLDTLKHRSFSGKPLIRIN